MVHILLAIRLIFISSGTRKIELEANFISMNYLEKKLLIEILTIKYFYIENRLNLIGLLNACRKLFNMGLQIIENYMYNKSIKTGFSEQ